MATLDSLESLLAEALQCMDDAASQVRELADHLETDKGLRRIGCAITDLWELRDQIHKIRPDLKPPFVTEYEHNRVRYEQLQEIADQAHGLERSGKLDQAREKFAEILALTDTGYFRMVAEAGLYRLENTGRSDA